MEEYFRLLNGANTKNTLKYWYGWVVENKKHVRGSIQATISPLAIILTAALWALVSIIAKGSIVILILPPLCFLY